MYRQVTDRIIADLEAGRLPRGPALDFRLRSSTARPARQPLRTPEEGDEIPSPAPDGVDRNAAAETRTALPTFLPDPDASAPPDAGASPQAAE